MPIWRLQVTIGFEGNDESELFSDILRVIESQSARVDGAAEAGKGRVVGGVNTR